MVPVITFIFLEVVHFIQVIILPLVAVGLSHEQKCYNGQKTGPITFSSYSIANCLPTPHNINRDLQSDDGLINYAVSLVIIGTILNVSPGRNKPIKPVTSCFIVHLLIISLVISSWHQIRDVDRSAEGGTWGALEVSTEFHIFRRQEVHFELVH